jgi:peptidoglycan/LPS O-acetylase OafA/YrhL
MDNHYRPDIDGLRGCAIFLVVCFHFFPKYFPGGFIGVDIFFVISGFLITRIICEQLINHDFSFIDFYLRRVKRLFPALFLVLSTSLIICWFIFLTTEYYSLAKNVFAATTFTSNFLLWHESGYFDAKHLFKPLLHLWSLAVEEQFYFLWPFTLCFFYRIKKVLFYTVIFFSISFIFNLYYIYHKPISAFYFPWSRYWEILSGSLVYLIRNNRSRNRLFSSINNPYQSSIFCNFSSLLGTFLILIALLKLNKDSLFPGYFALFPVIGASLIISSPPKNLVNVFIANPVLVFLGLISYPLYLWHWPLLSYLYILRGEHISIAECTILLILSLSLAYLTYRYCECPIRKKLQSTNITSLVLIFGIVIIALISRTIIANKGFFDRKVAIENKEFLHQTPINANTQIPCNLGGEYELLTKFCWVHKVDNPKKTIVLYGDSSSGAWSPVFSHISKMNNYNLYVISHPQCAPIFRLIHRHNKLESDDIQNSSYCSNGELQKQSVAYIKSLSPDIIFYIGAWNYANDLCLGSKVNNKFYNDFRSKEGLLDTINELSAIGHLVVFKAWPMLADSPNYQVKRLAFLQKIPLVDVPKNQFLNENFCMNNIINTSINSNRPIEIFDPAEKVCASETCVSILENTRMYVDKYHISPEGSMLYEMDLKKLIIK